MKFNLIRVAAGDRQQTAHLRKKLTNVLRQLFTPSPKHQIGMFAGSLLSYESWTEPKIPH